MSGKGAPSAKTLQAKFDERADRDDDALDGELRYMLNRLQELVETRESVMLAPNQIPPEVLQREEFIITLHGSPHYSIGVKPETATYTKIGALAEEVFVSAGYEGRADFDAKVNAPVDADVTLLVYRPDRITLFERYEKDGNPFRAIGNGAAFHKPAYKLN